MNPNLPRRHRGRVHPAAARRRRAHRRRHTASCWPATTSACPILGDVAEMGNGDPAGAPPPYRHHADDPIAITHSSGTTRMPTAVVHSHSSLFAATRRIRLSGPRAQGTERVAQRAARPARRRHRAVNQALCNRSELLFLSRQDDGATRAGRDRAVAADRRVRLRGDLGRAGPLRPEPSTTWTRWRSGSTPATARTRRTSAGSSRSAATRSSPARAWSGCPARASSTASARPRWATRRSTSPTAATPTATAAASASRTSSPRWRCWTSTPARRCRSARSGTLGLKSPTLALGYWNDSVTTYRNRLRGYYLTGDLMYRDEDGYYYHVDRAVDAVDLGDGNWLYTAMSEERDPAALPGRPRLHRGRGARRRPGRHRRAAAAARRGGPGGRPDRRRSRPRWASRPRATLRRGRRGLRRRHRRRARPARCASS